ncbi:hypothetical protein F0919_11345 [Taibaiella lutea]|uniref:Uncharacterized protein n=1 Tax=Taibaiella lutea TaxID=2608001 RepID=A0A5M6CD83_9BACT|nr:hypothetical protein [Taibaiella lutea]KAA5533138.1 hypothetical protein F0919_11345 [Taibaiella lutea]
MDINKGNIEEYLLLLLDGELSKTDEEKVMAFIESSPEYKTLLDEYLLTKLEPETVVFEDKAILLKEEAVVLLFKKKQHYTAWAAAIAVIIVAGIFFQMMHKKTIVTEPLVTYHSSEDIVTDTTSGQSLAIQKNDTKEILKPVTRHPVSKKNITVAKNISTIAVVSVPKVQPLNSLHVAGLKMMDVKPYGKIIAAEIPVENIDNIPVNNTLVSNNDDLESEKSTLFNNLIAQVETLKDKVAEKTKSLRISAVSIQLGNKEFTIGK